MTATQVALRVSVLVALAALAITGLRWLLVWAADREQEPADYPASISEDGV